MSKVGVLLPSRVTFAPAEYVALARTIEAAGFHSLWVADHLIAPAEIKSNYPFSEDGRSGLEPSAAWCESLTLLGYLSAVTTRLRFGTCVTPVITRDPLSLAKQAATVDVLSGGRLELGLGAGWLLEEAKALGKPTDRRIQRLKETLDILHLAWTRRSFRYDGEMYQFPEVGVHPQPVQGASLPVWVGGHGTSSISVAAKRATGLIAWLPTVEEARRIRKELARRKPTALLASSIRLEIGADPAHEAERVANLAAEGVDLVLILAPSNPEAMGSYLSRLAPAVSRAIA